MGNVLIQNYRVNRKTTDHTEWKQSYGPNLCQFPGQDLSNFSTESLLQDSNFFMVRVRG
jgi:hypothetical protein